MQLTCREKYGLYPKLGLFLTAVHLSRVPSLLSSITEELGPGVDVNTPICGNKFVPSGRGIGNSLNETWRERKGSRATEGARQNAP